MATYDMADGMALEDSAIHACYNENGNLQTTLGHAFLAQKTNFTYVDVT